MFYDLFECPREGIHTRACDSSKFNRVKKFVYKKRNICINDLVFSPELFHAFKSKAGVVHANFFKTFFLSRKNSCMFYKKKQLIKSYKIEL